MSVFKDKLKIDNKTSQKKIQSGEEIDLHGKTIESLQYSDWKIQDLESKLKQQQELIDKLEEEISSLKRKTGYTMGFWKRECNNCGHDSSIEN